MERVKNSKKSAFPCIELADHSENLYASDCMGLTKREHFAAMFLQAIITEGSTDPYWSIYRTAVHHADNLIEELGKELQKSKDETNGNT